MPTVTPTKVQALHVVSDLHFGPDEELQLFDAPDAMTTALQAMRTPALLVLNGDVVDFLADRHARTFDPFYAASTLSRRVVPKFREVFNAWGNFLEREGNHLCVAVGNHDLELALPEVKEAFYEALGCRQRPERLGRVTFERAGGPLEVSVGDRRVRIVHGNASDRWNMVDYEALRRWAERGPDEPQPALLRANAGTQLVVDVINPRKHRYRFVDLLKPEGLYLALMLVSLDPTKLGAVATAARLAGHSLWDGLRHGVLGAESEPARESDAELVSRLALGLLAETPTRPSGAAPEVSSLARAHRAFQEGLDPVALAAVGSGDAKARLWVGDGRPMPGLRSLLRAVCRRSAGAFDVHTPSDDDEHIWATESTRAPMADLLVAGHTHHARWCPPSEAYQGRPLYVNTGTWIPLLLLEPGLVEAEDDFVRLYQAIDEGTLEALSRQRYLKRTCTVLSVEAREGGAEARLWNAYDGEELARGPVPRRAP